MKEKDKIYNFIEFSNPNKPTIYDEIKKLEGIELYNRLIFEFSIRNKQNKERSKSIIREYNDNKKKINDYIELIKIVDSSGAMSYLEEDFYNEECKNAFFNLEQRLNNIEFLSFNYYSCDSKFRHQLIPSELFEIINLMYQSRILYSKNTQETQFDRPIDKNTIEVIGDFGHDMRYECVNSSKFNIQNIYDLSTEGYFFQGSILEYNKKDFTINPKYVKKVSLKINLLSDNESIKKVIENFISDLDEIKIHYKNALNKYEDIKLKETSEPIVQEFYKKTHKNTFYANLLYAYDMQNKYSEKEIIENYKKLFPEMDSKKPTERLKTYLNKSIFKQYLKMKLKYRISSNYLEKELNKLEQMIDKKYYLK